MHVKAIVHMLQHKEQLEDQLPNLCSHVDAYIRDSDRNTFVCFEVSQPFFLNWKGPVCNFSVSCLGFQFFSYLKYL